MFRHDSAAVWHSLQCTLPGGKDWAWCYVTGVIRAHDGHAGDIARSLGISRRQYERWRETIPELAREHTRVSGLAVMMTGAQRKIKSKKTTT